MEEMWSYCGTVQKVLKRGEKFLDECDYLVKKRKGVVILDGILCQGTKILGLVIVHVSFSGEKSGLEKLSEFLFSKNG